MDIEANKADSSQAQAGLSDTPGVLRNQARLRLETRQAQSLIAGRTAQEGKGAIIGLDGFARYMTQIWRSATANDPYADWALLRIEQLIEQTRQSIRSHIQEIAAILDAMPAVEIEQAHSVDPIHVPLAFTNPYGYLGAYLLADFDELVRTVLTARHCGIIDRDRAFQLLFRAGRPLRRIFCLPPTLWRYTGVTREDLLENRKLALQARAVYESMKIPELPEDILQGQLRGKFAPRIRQTLPAASQYLEEEGDGN